MLHWPPSTTTVFVITIVILKSSASSDKPSSLLCQTDWIYIDIADKCIKGSKISGSNDDNLKYCNDLNASMVTIDSTAENDEIFKQFSSLYIFRFWIAGKTEGLLIDGKKPRTKVDLMKSTNFTNWGQNSPHCPSNEQCCIMVNSHKQWQDLDCSDDLNFACEKRRIFESSEFNPIVSAENPSPEEIECSGEVILEMMAPKNMSQLDEIFAKANSEIEANHTISETTSPSKPEVPSPESQPPKLNKSRSPEAETSRFLPKYIQKTLISQSAALSANSSLLDSSPSASTSLPSIATSSPASTSPVPSLSTATSPASPPSTSSSPASSSTLLLSTLPPLTKSISVSSSPKPPVVTVSEELINHIIKRYQKNQLNVIRLWFDLIRTHRNSSERSRQFQRSIKDEGFQLSNYLLVMLTALSILVLVATIITLLIITRRFLRQKTQDTYQMSSRLLELGYD